MERDAFDGAFQRLVLDALARAGFRSSGKTAYLATPELTVGLIRLGGRMAPPGSAAHVLCFRHTFLRGLQDGGRVLQIFGTASLRPSMTGWTRSSSTDA